MKLSQYKKELEESPLYELKRHSKTVLVHSRGKYIWVSVFNAIKYTFLTVPLSILVDLICFIFSPLTNGLRHGLSEYILAVVDGIKEFVNVWTWAFNSGARYDFCKEKIREVKSENE